MRWEFTHRARTLRNPDRPEWVAMMEQRDRELEEIIDELLARIEQLEGP